jgi:uncharacterized membrane protein
MLNGTMTTASTVDNRRLFRPINAARLARGAITVITLLLSIAIALVALGSGTGIIPLPYEMFRLREEVPLIFSAHMVTSAVALLLAPLVIMMRRRQHLHRRLGRLVGAFVVAGGLTALPVAIFSHSPLLARAGFFVQGIVWLALLTAGMAAIRLGDRNRHARLMLAMFAVATGAVWFRLITGAAILAQAPFEPIYSAAAWIGWMAPLALVFALPDASRVLNAKL